MDPQALKDRLQRHTAAVDAIRVTSDLHPSVRAGIAKQLDGIAEDVERDVTPAVRAASDPALSDELARLYRGMAMINSWLEGRKELGRAWIDRAAEFATSDVLRDLVTADQNGLRDGEAFEGIRSLCQRGLVDKARRQLVKRRKSTADPVMKKRIDEFLADPRNFIAPIRSAPSMMTYNGVGTMLHGERDRKADGSYVATLCIVFLFIPLIPLRSYLVQRVQQGWRFYGRVPLSPFAFWWRRLILLGPLLFGLGAWGVDAYDASPRVREERALSAAGDQIGRRDYAGALKTLKPLAWTGSESRSARMKELWGKALTAALEEIDGPERASRFLASSGATARELNRPLDARQAAAADAALKRLASGPESAPSTLNLIAWLCALSPEYTGKQADLALRACAGSKDPQLLAGAVDLCVAASRPCPPEILRALKEALLRSGHPTWNADAVTYLRAADPADARPVLLARLETPWKGAGLKEDLSALANLPEPFRRLCSADAERDPAKRAELLEKAAEAAGLPEPEQSWHRLGVARRLAKTYGELNEADPVHWPIAKAHPWAVRAAELAPDDAEARVTAVRYLVQDGDFDKAIALGTPALQEPKTALLVGIATARSGKPEDAAKLLRPIVERDLPAYVAGVREWNEATENKTNNTWRSLTLGTAPQAIIRSLNSLPQDKAQLQAARWVQEQVDRDPQITALSAKVRQLGDIHTAATELAMIELGLGQSLAKGPARQARLEAAEHLFLELRKVLGNDPHQELQLGQVYFWLGKDKEGAEIFDKLEQTADGPLLYKMGEIYRNLARMDTARRVLERAYEKSSGEEKEDIALTRAITNTSKEDRLLWLKKADPKSSRVRVEIDQAEAEIDMEAGRFDEAVPALKRVAAYYAGLPERTMVLNNGALIQFDLARSTGDQKYHMEALRLMRRAHESSPEDAIVLSNYVYELQQAGVAALAGNALRADLLHETPHVQWMDFVEPRPTPEETAVKAKAQPELRRSAELGVRSTVLSPDGTTGYQTQIYFLRLTRDAAGIRRLREQVESRPAPHKEDEQGEETRAPGAKVEARKKALERSLTRWEQLLPGLRKAGHAPSLAYALMSSAGIRLDAALHHVGNETFELALRDAEEAVSVYDCAATRHGEVWIRMQQASVLYAARDSSFAEWLKESPEEEASLLLFFYLRKNPETAAGFRRMEETRRAARAAADLFARNPRHSWARGWSWLRMAGDGAEEEARKIFLGNPTALEEYRIDWLLVPGSFEEAGAAWLAAELAGDTDLIAKIAASMRAKKQIPRYFKE
jgi:tetratricopeptide (TPR) repeat protein